MSLFSGYEFFFYLFVLLLPAIILGVSEKHLRYYRCFLTCVFIWMAYSQFPTQFMYLMAYAIGSLYLVKMNLVLTNSFGKNKYIIWHMVALAVIPLLISKWSSRVGGTLFCFLGISYLCFRVVQVLIESYDGLIKEISVLEYLDFLLFFPCLSSGPIDRSRRYLQDCNKLYPRSEYLQLLNDGIYKLILGVFYKIVCSAYLFDLLKNVFAAKNSPLYLIGYSYTYGLYMFFDFAGYSAMAIGVSYILGIRTPENFNKPFISLDLKDFWNRWHISLSTWFRDFLFSRFTMDAIRKKRFDSRLTTASVGLILNMGIMGIWHGFYGHYIAYGLYHGILLAVTEVYQKKSGFYKKNKDKRWYKILSWFITLNIVMFGFLIFSGHIQEVWSRIKI